MVQAAAGSVDEALALLEKQQPGIIILSPDVA
jgi:hypothetical protein